MTSSCYLLIPIITELRLEAKIAAWCDISAAISAQRFCRKPVVTASMDELHFLQPVKKGMVVILRSQVNQAWRTSMEVGVRVEAEDPFFRLYRALLFCIPYFCRA